MLKASRLQRGSVAAHNAALAKWVDFGDLIQRVIGADFPGKPQRQTQFLAHGGIDSDRGKNAHRRARSEAAERLRPQFDPIPGLALLEGGQPVDLVEVVVGRHVPGVALACRCREGPEVRAVVFRARHQDHARELGRCLGDGRDGIDQHVAIGSDVGGVARSCPRRSLERCIENVRDVGEPGKLGLYVLLVQQVDGDVAVARPAGGVAPRQADN